ncbi:MAG: hypothetical protein A3F70_02220 [Acidobacteria bacterium RIFCSPLOWO2_12_FULL_67_14]|nr:MAG: hypothetical protein A3F70_02220 [Acidobacteria bacterium RIFCSPLOWO2_12_FULL_67_14]
MRPLRETCSMIKAAKYLGGSVLLAALMTTSLVPLRASAGPSGGHVTITLTTMPDRPVAAEDTRVTIVLKDERQQPLGNASVLVRADMIMSGMAGMQHGSAGPTATAKPSEKPGEYLATLRLTDPGDWRISVTTGHSSGEFKVTVLPPTLESSAATSPSTAPTSQRSGADEGRAATADGTRVIKGHDDGHGAAKEAAGPNYYFVGSILGVVVITIGMVPILRRRGSRAERAEAA